MIGYDIFMTRRQRLTITLRADILKELDKKIDGDEIRNRSHAIESILSKNLMSQISRVLILAGGNGVKMRPFTYEMPKTMLPIHNRPLLEHILEVLRKYNLRDVVISTGYLGDKIQNHFGDGSRFGAQIKYSTVTKETGTAQPVRKAKNFLDGSSFLVVYGDVLADINLDDFIEFHESHKGVVSMALTSVRDTEDWGVVKLHGSKIIEFTEKPNKEIASHLINSGIYIFRKEIFDYISLKTKSLEKDVFPKLAKQGKLFGYSFSGKWFDVGTPKIYEKVLKEWKEVK